MKTRIILRFRDLITEEDGTINDHLNLINHFGEVWWGWWMRQYETPPRELFKEITERIEAENNILGYLYNTGTSKFYSISISKILVAPQDNRIGTPNPETSPSYYHRGQYPAWFLLNSIEEKDFSKLKLIYNSFPTRPDIAGKLSHHLDKKITSLEELRNIDVTMWEVQAK